MNNKSKAGKQASYYIPTAVNVELSSEPTASVSMPSLTAEVEVSGVTGTNYKVPLTDLD